MEIITFTKETLQQALDLHKKWLKNEPDGKRFDVSNRIVKFDFELSEFPFKNVDFSNANFSGSDFSRTDFSDANFGNANFSGTDFRNADFNDAHFNDANFSFIYFDNTNFSSTDFRNAYFNNADFNSAYFNNAHFNSADFSSTNFNHANFYHTSFYNTNFSGADFSNSDFIHTNFNSTIFSGTDFNNTAIDWNCIFKNADECTAFLNLQCPEAGSFIAYKMARNCLIKLEIPADALRSSATTRKCRASKAKVLEITDENGKKIKFTCSDRTSKFIYEVGKTIYSQDDDGNIAFDENRWNECSTGIHFFMSKQEAINYNQK